MDTSGEKSSSSDDLESKIEFTMKPLKKVCVFCRKSGGVTANSTQKSLDTVLLCMEKREYITKEIDNELHNAIIYTKEKKTFNNLIWHRNCYSSYTSKRNIEHLENKMLKHYEAGISGEPSSVSGMSLRKENFLVERCVFCQKLSMKKKVSQVMTKNAEFRIRLIAEQNQEIFERIGANDLIGMEIKYHVSCFLHYWKKLKQNGGPRQRTNKQTDLAFEKLCKILQAGFAKQKGYGITNMYNKYLELNGKKSRRQIVRDVLKKFESIGVELSKSKRRNEEFVVIPKKTKDETIQTLMEEVTSQFYEPVVATSSDLSQIHKTCCDIKVAMDKIPDYKDLKNLDVAAYKQYVPELLYWFVCQVVSNDGTNKTKELRTLSICQDIIFTYSKGRKRTPKHIGFGLMIHQETKSKKLIDSLHSTGHCINYKEVIRLRNTIAQLEINRFIENDNVVIPRQLQANRFLQFAADNIDILEETLDKSPTFHATQMIAFQQGPPADVSTNDHLKLLAYRPKLNIPESFHMLRESHFQKTMKSTPKLKSKDILNFKDDDNIIWQHNISWILCRLTNSNNLVIPQWSGFNKIMASENIAVEEVTTYGYLPLLPYVSTEYDTVWTIMKRCESITKKLSVPYTVISFDQAIYCKAKELQWLKHLECEDFILRLGGFHIMLNFIKVIGQHMEHSGLRDIWIESELYGEATVNGILSGKKWNKAIRAHKLTYESLMRMMLPHFEQWLAESENPDVHNLNEGRILAQQVIDEIRRGQNCCGTFATLKSTIAKTRSMFHEYVVSQSTTLQLWFSYTRLVEILLEFIYSERLGIWQLHLSSFRQMLPWFFAYDHANYARWGSVYLLDMQNIPPYIQQEFENGHFVVKRLPGVFNKLSIDQALEHVNKRSKDAGGIVGLTKNSTRLDEWFLTYNDIGMMVDLFQTSLDRNKNIELQSQNIEAGTERMKVDESSVLVLQEQFQQFRLLDRNDDNLICIPTNEIIPKTVELAIMNARNSGEEALADFLGVMDTNTFYKPIKKQNLQRKLISKDVAKKVDKVKEAQGGQKFLQQILAAKEMGRNVDYNSVFRYELSTYPLALSANGMLSTPTNKSSLGHILEQYTTSLKELPPYSGKTCHIFDAMSLVQSLGKPATVRTFGEYGNVFNSLVFRNKFGASRIDIVFDHYNNRSIKNGTRLKRKGTANATINKIIDAPETPLPQQWHLFIHSIQNKHQLTQFLSNYLLQYQHQTDIEVVTSGGFATISDYKSNFGLRDDLLDSTHEEADTRILLHILSAKKAGYSRCIIECRDTDVLVLLAHFKNNLSQETWLIVGSKESPRFIPIHLLTMETHLLKNLPGFHAVTGCDTTSQFTGLGKKLCWKTYLSHFDLIDELGTGDFGNEQFQQLQKFVINMYSPKSNVNSINDLRAKLALCRTINKLPPTEDSLFQHCLRAHFQTQIWLNSLNPRPQLPDVSAHGWYIDEENDTLLPIFQTLQPVPKDIAILSTCKCKKDCASKLCSCKKNKLPCIYSCSCMGQKNCKHSQQKQKPSFNVISPIFEEESDSE